MSQIPKLIRVLSVADRAELDQHLRDGRMTYEELVAWLATRGCHTTVLSLRKYAINEGLRTLKAHAFLRIDRMLSDEDRVAYEALLANPRTSSRDARAWLLARGYKAAGDTVITHRRRFLETLAGVRRTARLASAIAQLAREHGDVTMSNAMLTRFEQVMLEQFIRTTDGTPVAPKDLGEMSKSVASAVGSRERFAAMLREFEDAKQRALAGADAAAQRGATGPEVVERVREILGV